MARARLLVVAALLGLLFCAHGVASRAGERKPGFALGRSHARRRLAAGPVVCGNITCPAVVTNCTLVGNVTTCLCPSAMRLSTDQRSCVSLCSAACPGNSTCTISSSAPLCTCPSGFKLINGTCSASDYPNSDFMELVQQARTAVGTQLLTWDTTLAARANATAWGNAVKCSPSGGDRGGVAQLMAGGNGNLKGLPNSRAIREWLGAAAGYVYGPCTSQVNAYTQLIWSSNRLIGCGAGLCSGGGKIWICNLAPGGNVKGQYPYSRDPCYDNTCTAPAVCNGTSGAPVCQCPAGQRYDNATGPWGACVADLCYNVTCSGNYVCTPASQGRCVCPSGLVPQNSTFCTFSQCLSKSCPGAATCLVNATSNAAYCQCPGATRVSTDGLSCISFCPAACPGNSTCYDGTANQGPPICICPTGQHLSNSTCTINNYNNSDWLDLINGARAAVGSNPVVWDPALASRAQVYGDGQAAKGCKLTPGDLSGVGQLLAGAGSGLASVPNMAAVRTWLSNGGNGPWPPFNGNNLQYYQIVWSANTRLGCSVSVCGSTGKLWLCDFAPGGNVKGVLPFSVDPCYDNTCAPPALCNGTSGAPVCQCPNGQRYDNTTGPFGSCVSDSCDGVVCPGNYVCTVASAGACVCPDGLAPKNASFCTYPACVNVTCPPLATCQVNATDNSTSCLCPNAYLPSTDGLSCISMCPSTCPAGSSCNGGYKNLGPPSCVCDSATHLINNTCSNATLPNSDWLDLMNAARAAVGSPPLVWDPTLATRAQTWADTLASTAKGCKLSPGDTSGIGRNLAGGSGNLQSVSNTMAVRTWVLDGQNHVNWLPFDGSDPAYTQVIWSRNYAVGCGVSQCQVAPKTGKIWICDYSPGGNVLGQSPFALNPCYDTTCPPPSVCNGTTGSAVCLCPPGQRYDSTVGQYGSCVTDLCANVTCPGNTQCTPASAGQCVCPAGLVTQNATFCTYPACANVTCAPGASCTVDPVTNSSFCQCPQNFTLSTDGTSCISVCYAACPGKSTCYGGSKNQGPPMCVCPSGQRLINKACSSANLTNSDWLDLMNSARAAVGSPPLTWDTTLATNALTWATSLATHGCGLSIGSPGQLVAGGSQNLASLPNSRAVRTWLEDGMGYWYRMFDGGSPGYTQIVWSSSAKVGCAVATCQVAPKVGRLWVCNFNPGGNINGQSPFYMDPCYDNTCQSPAICNATTGSALCQCPVGQLYNDTSGFGGAKAKQTVLNKASVNALYGNCANNLCYNITCLGNLVCNQGSCVCPSGFVPENATFCKIPQCVGVVCPVNSTCALDASNNTFCQCPPNFRMNSANKTCISVCTAPCPSTSICTASGGTPICKCPSGQHFVNGTCSTAILPNSDWLDPMNNARAAVGSPFLVWDDTVAQQALAWATTLTSNSSCQLQAGNRAGVGQTLAGGNGNYGSVSNTQAVNLWVSDGSSFTYGPFNGGDPFYSQIIWASSTRLGCGVTPCPLNGGKGKVWVCDYAPAGNIQGMYPYTRSPCYDVWCPDISVCNGTSGSGVCQCPAGQILANGKCIQDMCLGVTCPGNYICNGLDGTAQCLCPDGLVPQNSTTCTYAACVNYTCPAASWCAVDSNSTAYCQCPDGFKISGNQCLSVCTATCPDTSVCTVYRKGPICRCPQGQRLINSTCTSDPLLHSEWLDPIANARAAVGLPALVWDDILATRAAAYGWNLVVNQSCALIHGDLSGVGQTLAGGSGNYPSNFDSTAATYLWIAEGSMYTYAMFDGKVSGCSSGSWKDCGHYIQIIWGSTKRVGCAAVPCNTTGSGRGTVWICDYNPPGNLFNTYPYTINPCYNYTCPDISVCNGTSGQAVCQCPVGQALLYNNTCAPDPCLGVTCPGNYICNSTTGSSACVCPNPFSPYNATYCAYPQCVGYYCPPMATCNVMAPGGGKAKQILRGADTTNYVPYCSCPDGYLLNGNISCLSVCTSPCPDTSVCTARVGGAPTCACPSGQHLVNNICTDQYVPFSDWLDPMNNARAAVGSNPLVWDAPTAVAAQTKADTLANTGCGLTASSGQTLAGGSGNYAWGTDNTSVVNLWVRQGAQYTYAQQGGGCATGNWADCASYTQVIWSSSKRLGCGVAVCATGSSASSKIWVCNFSPGGNVKNAYPYVMNPCYNFTCPATAKCDKSSGSAVCVCPGGQSPINGQCSADPCLKVTCPGNLVCNSTSGKSDCVCPSGLAPKNATLCTDPLCVNFTCPAVALCLVNNRIPFCRCPDGFIYSGGKCISACTRSCPDTSVCTNNNAAGGPTCNCPTALRLINATCSNQSLPYSDFLDPINAARAAVGSPPVVWDDAAATNSLTYGLSLATTQKCKLVPQSGKGYGMTLAAGSSNSSAAVLWVNQGSRYTYSRQGGGCATGNWMDCGAYTQLIWGSTKRVGCASVACPTGGNFILCSWSPVGNVANSYPYNIDPCYNYTCADSTALCNSTSGAAVCQCPVGQYLFQNACVADPCLTTTCPGNFVCDSSSGAPACICPSGLLPVNGSFCTYPQCLNITCPSTSTCTLYKGVPYCSCPAATAMLNDTCTTVPTAAISVIQTAVALYNGTSGSNLRVLPPSAAGSLIRNPATWKPGCRNIAPGIAGSVGSLYIIWDLQETVPAGFSKATCASVYFFSAAGCGGTAVFIANQGSGKVTSKNSLGASDSGFVLARSVQCR